MEIDFLVSKISTTSRHNVSVLEVKSGKKYTLSSLGKFKKKYEQMLYKCIVVHTADFKIENDIVYLPLYMTPFI